MMQKSVQNQAELAAAFLDITPKLLQRLLADVPLRDDTQEVEDATENCPGLRDVTELRATPGQLTLLRVLIDHDRCSMQELAEYLGVTPSTATAMVKRLLAQGYLERSHDNVNWRTVWVKPTEPGRRAVEIFERVRLASLQRRLEQLSDEERASIAAALPALRHLVELK
jgi:DNA-binding MarR family transcriptional regulator